MKSKQEISAIITALKALYPDAQCSLDYGKDYELLFFRAAGGPVYRRTGESGDPGTFCPLPHAGGLCGGGRG